MVETAASVGVELHVVADGPQHPDVAGPRHPVVVEVLIAGDGLPERAPAAAQGMAEHETAGERLEAVAGRRRQRPGGHAAEVDRVGQVAAPDELREGVEGVVTGAEVLRRHADAGDDREVGAEALLRGELVLAGQVHRGQRGGGFGEGAVDGGADPADHRRP